MGQQNLSDFINNIVDNQISYDKLDEGQILTIFATDAVDEKIKPIQIQVVSKRKSKNEALNFDVTFMFLNNNFACLDGNFDPKIIPGGTLAETGYSATFYPNTMPTMLVCEGIGIGRDHLFQNVNGEEDNIIIKGIESIKISDSPKDWQKPVSLINEHLERINKLDLQREEEKRINSLKILRTRIVHTKNSCYLLGEPDKESIRTIQKVGGNEIFTGCVTFLKLNDTMYFQFSKPYDGRYGMTTSEVLKTEPPWDDPIIFINK